MVKALKDAGGSVKWTLFPEANHNAWDPAFAEPELISWLLSKHRK
jgi:predicted peptidase